MEWLLVAWVIGLAVWLQPQPQVPTEAPVAAPVVEPDRVVLLPGADGSVGRVIIQSAGGTQEIFTPFGALVVNKTGELTPYAESADAVNARHADLLAIRPMLPKSYLLYFKHGGNELTEASLQTLELLRRDAAQRSVPDILVIGHTDRVGSAAQNDALSLRRAQAIEQRLTQEFGVKPRTLEAVGRGESDPLVQTADGVDEPRNRRVEVSIR